MCRRSLYLFHLFAAPSLENHIILQAEPDVRTFLQLVGYKIPHKWRGLGAYLGVPQNEIELIAHHNEPVDPTRCQCLSAVFNYWKNHQTDKEPTWNDLVSAVKNVDDSLSREMINKLMDPALQNLM